MTWETGGHTKTTTNTEIEACMNEPSSALEHIQWLAAACFQVLEHIQNECPKLEGQVTGYNPPKSWSEQALEKGWRTEAGPSGTTQVTNFLGMLAGLEPE